MLKIVNCDKIIRIQFEQELLNVFARYCADSFQDKTSIDVSMRGEKTYIFPCADKYEYLNLVNDKVRFMAEVVSKLGEYCHATGHRSSCKGAVKYTLAGFRDNPRRTLTGERQEEYPIRMVKCSDCKQRFSLLPSFLPREKHFHINIIANVFQNMLLFGQSIQGCLQNLKITGKGVNSKQTILNWLRWIGALHPATILTRAGVIGSGYLQEDEGFEKEPNLRTYSVVMVEPKTLLVWHADYVDHVDEDTLCSSFEAFISKVSFKILGITKDKWQASTNALKAVMKNVWIGYCHRHCLRASKNDL